MAGVDVATETVPSASTSLWDAAPRSVKVSLIQRAPGYFTFELVLMMDIYVLASAVIIE